MKLKLSSPAALIAFFLVCGLTQGVGAYFTFESLQDWYPMLNKPSWTPPGWVFGPVWSLLYAAMAVAGWLVWRRRLDEDYEGFPILLFLLQLILNGFWSALFFGTRSPGWAFYEICLLWLVVLFTVINFNRISKTAALLMLPYLGWLTFAACLNFSIWRLN